MAAGADPSWLLHGFSRCGYRAEGAGPPVFCGRSALRYVAATFSACRHRGLETSATSRTLNPMHDSSLPSLRAWVSPCNRASACQLSAPGFAGACQIDRRASSRCHGSAVRGGKSARVDQRWSAPARALRARAQLTDPGEELAYVAEWRKAFRAFGAKPQRTRAQRREPVRRPPHRTRRVTTHDGTSLAAATRRDVAARET